MVILLKFELVKPAINYLKEVRLELSKVVWPKREEVIKLTLIVIIISVIVGLYLGALDFIYTKLLELLINR
ncbi:preprotein translocase subunit SecE [Candidatus Woesebacteria bacterium RBG_16_39_8b]|uniref:Protein translocase subunit SecE n=1 Tax=Candidatus Woesebacteria bacterium RBG_16_39_8b TaxID=1802482 RepID=A0A1F7XHZ4_9BACT|nr:MAG: preprotein translocase subunit SecE [Candidatus Woesebacteria bacterium RBG_16_39_8b]